MKSKQKTIGQVFTPQFIVSAMLDYCGYFGNGIVKKHIIDNSCGDGAFLKEIVARYISAARGCGMNDEELAEDLSQYVHGIDNDINAYEACLDNLDEIACREGLPKINWDVKHANSLAARHFDGMMDYVVGNPPYVRVHNLDDSYDAVKQFKFANGGMTDLYLAFFELGFKMLSPTGKLCYITPSSWLNSLAATNMRFYIMRKRTLTELIDLGHFQPFENATAYTIISLFDNSATHNKSFAYYQYDGARKKRVSVSQLSFEDSFIEGCLYLSDKATLATLRAIKTKKTDRFVTVKNGFATLADSVFIGSCIPDSPITIPVTKASTGKATKCLFPYDKQGKPLPQSYIFSFESVANHLLASKVYLLKGKEEKEDWYLFGRTQALADVYRDKLSINALIRDERDLKIKDVPSGEGIYSGLYIISNISVSLQSIREVLCTAQFAHYIKALKKYKSGGYYTYNSKDVEQYINYVISLNPNKYVEQPKISQSHSGLFQELY